MRALILLVLVGLANLAFGQTPLIAWKSHSGHIDQFIPAVRSGHFDTKNHHLGMAPQPMVAGASLDTVIYVNDSTTIVITSRRMTRITQCEQNGAEDSLWQPGRYTIVNDPFWTCGNVDQMISVLETSFYFVNAPSTTVFIGFPEVISKGTQEKEESYQKEELLPIGIWHPQKPTIVWALIGVFGLAILTGFLTWRKQLRTAVT